MQKLETLRQIIDALKLELGASGGEINDAAINGRCIRAEQ
jgi:hypothetical protein